MRLTDDRGNQVSGSLSVPVTAKGAQQPDIQPVGVRLTSVKWTPDGQALLLTVMKVDPTTQAPVGRKLIKFDLRTREAEELSISGGNLAMSPDGKTIAFVKRNERNQSDIYFYDIQTKKETALAVDALNKNNPNWSPDGKRLAYNIDAKKIEGETVIEICVVDLATRQVEQITNTGKYRSYSPKWSPGGNEIVYFLEKGDKHDQIYLTNLHGTFHRNLTNDMASQNYAPAWIDAETISYTRNPNEIMTIKKEGGTPELVAGVHANLFQYSQATKRAVYVVGEESRTLMLYDWRKKTDTILIDSQGILNLIK